MSVYKRGSIWYYDFMIRRHRYRGAIPEARTRAHARRVETDKREEVYAGRYGRPGETVTLKRFITETYLPWAKIHKRSWADDEWRLAKVIIPFFRETRLADVSPIQIEKFKRERMAQPAKRGNSKTSVPRAPATVNYEIDALSQVLTMAVEHGLIPSNPCKKVKRLTVDNERKRVCTAEEEKLLRENMPPRLTQLFDVAIHTGARCGELVSLDWECVNLERGEFTIEAQRSKTGKERTIPMNATVREIFTRLGDERRDGQCFVFTNKNGEQYLRPNVTFRKVCKRIGIEGLRWHDLRHTAASRLADRGADQFTLAEILGHSDLRSTKRYTHATDAAKRRAVEAIAGYGEGATEDSSRRESPRREAVAPSTDCRKIVSIEERRKTA